MTVLRTFLVLTIFTFTSAMAGASGVPQSLDVTPLAIETEDGWHRFEVQVAKTPEQQRIGLMYRCEMADDHGMIFHNAFPQPVGVWMKNTYISLDIIFIQPDGTIVNIVKNAEPHSLETMNSQGWVTGVLELNGGLSEALGIEAGDIVHHEIFGNAVAPEND